MHYSRHRITASVAFVTTLTYAVTRQRMNNEFALMGVGAAGRGQVRLLCPFKRKSPPKPMFALLSRLPVR